jgi:hypothetical protein
MRVYQHSGIVPASGALMTAAAGSLAALFLGIAYSFSFYYIPFVYLNLLLACGFGAGVGYVVGHTAKEGKIRNVAVVGVIAVLAAMVGIYFEWGSTVYAMCAPTELSRLWENAGLAPFLPHHIVVLMFDLFAEGSWGFSENQMVCGWPLVFLWFAEAATIFGLAIATAVGQIKDVPFCEKCQEWIAGRAPHLYVGDGTELVWKDVQKGTFEPLALTPRANGDEPTYVRLTLAICEGCSENCYLTITACQNTVDSKGNPKLVQNDLVTNLILEPAQADIVQAANWIAPAPDGSAPDGSFPNLVATPAEAWPGEEPVASTSV